ncbi:hypothetical protein C8J57DRAFT_106031 [Mycena rebaudengoi]|nr:hypothetical protein C8J57DRAFT_106031 [Mycena rebaudengoi]
MKTRQSESTQNAEAPLGNGPTFGVARSRIVKLDAQIAVLELSLIAVRAERQNLQTCLDTYKYPILTLPIEITSEIFVHFLPPYHERPPATGLFSPRLLGQICRKWREIAFGTPQLWRAIELNPEKVSRTMALDLLTTWIARSKNCPLSISLQYSFPDEPDDEIDLIPFVETIIPHSERWEYIDFLLPLEALRPIPSDLPLLRSLTLGPSEHTEEPKDSLSLFGNAPNLKELTLIDSFAPSEIELPWSQFTSIFGHVLFETECAEILRHASALVEFRCDFVCLCDDGTTLVSVARLRCLQSLRLGDYYGDHGAWGHRRLVDALTTPALKHLEVSDSQLNASPVLNSLILRSHCTLASLRITQTTDSEVAYRATFPSIPTITVTHGL